MWVADTLRIVSVLSLHTICSCICVVTLLALFTCVEQQLIIAGHVLATVGSSYRVC